MAENRGGGGGEGEGGGGRYTTQGSPTNPIVACARAAWLCDRCFPSWARESEFDLTKVPEATNESGEHSSTCMW